MKAYAILDGGGVKGAALVGALQAAGEHGMEWLGFGGTSAGSIVATLSCVGYTPTELKEILVEHPFTDLLDDGNGSQIEELKAAARALLASATTGWLVTRPFRLAFQLFANRRLLAGLSLNLGIYKGDRLRSWLLEKIRAKRPNVEEAGDVTFGSLKRERCPPLKIVASNISHKTAVVFPDDIGETASVLDAVRASVCFPFLFQPVRLDPRRLVDGGLCSNLPAFLFDEDARRIRMPIVAVDLVPKTQAVPTPPPGLQCFANDMLDTVLEGSDKLLRDRLRNLHHVRVEIDPPVDSTDFLISVERRRLLFQNGLAAFHTYYATRLKPLEQARDVIQKLQALYASPDLVEPLLDVVAQSIQASTGAEQVRAHVMLPTLRNSRVVTYQFGMDGMPDRTLELDVGAGCSGQAFETGKPAYANLIDAQGNFDKWGMSQEQQDRIPVALRAMISVPLCDTSELTPANDTIYLADLPVIGTLSVDTVTDGQSAGWVEFDERGDVMINAELLDFLGRWADIIAKVLT